MRGFFVESFNGCYAKEVALFFSRCYIYSMIKTQTIYVKYVYAEGMEYNN